MKNLTLVAAIAAALVLVASRPRADQGAAARPVVATVTSAATAAQLGAAQDAGAAVASSPPILNSTGETAQLEAEEQLGTQFPDVGAFCRAWDSKIGAFLDERNKLPDDFTPKNHACRTDGPLFAGFRSTAEVTSITKVTVFSQNWTEDRFAIETPAGIYVPKGAPIGQHAFNDPGCYGEKTITLKSVTAVKGGNVAITYQDAWSKTSGEYTDDGVLLRSYGYDDISIVHDECSLSPGAGSKYACVSKILSRVCHSNGTATPCDSF